MTAFLEKLILKYREKKSILENLVCCYHLQSADKITFIIGFIPLSVKERTSINHNQNSGRNVLNYDINKIWHSQHAIYDKIPYILLEMEEVEKVFMVKVVDRLGCPACSGRFKDVEVRVAMTPSYDGAVSCGIKSGDGIIETVHK